MKTVRKLPNLFGCMNAIAGTNRDGKESNVMENHDSPRSEGTRRIK